MGGFAARWWALAAEGDFACAIAPVGNGTMRCKHKKWRVSQMDASASAIQADRFLQLAASNTHACEVSKHRRRERVKTPKPETYSVDQPYVVTG